jgi:hypothetical protein
MGNNYDPSKPSRYIQYYDANNLYGYAMVQPLPYGGFKFIDVDTFRNEYDRNDESVGYILEVDLEYPENLHDLHNDLPFCAESIVVTENMLSPLTKAIGKEHDIKAGRISKLVPNLMNKTKYVMHVKNLDQALANGLKLTKIHRVIKFNQKPWLKDYIDLNTEKRKLAKNEFEKDFFKLMNNSVYGKTMENIRKRCNVKLIRTQKKLNKCCSKPGMRGFKIFDDELIAVNMVKESVFLNKPIYVGMAILEVSKCHMYDFHYNVIKKRYGGNATLLFTDTDSLSYDIKGTDDVYRDMYEMREYFDLSDIKISEYNDQTNKKVLGKFKDEMNGVVISEFVGLRPKMYSLKYGQDDKEKKIAKGVVRAVIANDLRHNMYKSVLDKNGQMRHDMKMIRSDHHHMYTMNVNKITLCAYDDKRYICDNGIDTYAYGHYKI